MSCNHTLQKEPLTLVGLMVFKPRSSRVEIEERQKSCVFLYVLIPLLLAASSLFLHPILWRSAT